MKLKTIVLHNENGLHEVQAKRTSSTEEIIAALDLPRPRALLTLNGGTAALDADLDTQLCIVLDDELAHLVAHESIAVITGGTDAGIFHLFGQGIAKWDAPLPTLAWLLRAL